MSATLFRIELLAAGDMEKRQHAAERFYVR